MSLLGQLQSWIFLILVVVAFGFQVTALIDSLRYRDEVYQAAGKKTKKFWTILLAVATLFGLLALPPMHITPFFINLLGFVAAAVYFTDVRKALRSVDPRYRGY